MTAERVGVLALVGRVEEAVALGDAALHTLHGDAHAELCLGLARAAVVEARWAAVDSHVASLLAKTGASGRAELRGTAGSRR